MLRPFEHAAIAGLPRRSAWHRRWGVDIPVRRDWAGPRPAEIVLSQWLVLALASCTPRSVVALRATKPHPPRSRQSFGGMRATACRRGWARRCCRCAAGAAVAVGRASAVRAMAFIGPIARVARSDWRRFAPWPNPRSGVALLPRRKSSRPSDLDERNRSEAAKPRRRGRVTGGVRRQLPEGQRWTSKS